MLIARYMYMQREGVENCRAACVCFCPEDGIALYIIYRPYALMWQRRVARCAKKHYLWSLLICCFMIEIILVMAAGIAAGRLLRRVKALRVLPVTTMATIVALLFIMGGEIGGNKAVIAGLASSGVEALAIAAAATAGSVVAARVVYRRFFEHRKTAAGHEE